MDNSERRTTAAVVQIFKGKKSKIMNVLAHLHEEWPGLGPGQANYVFSRMVNITKYYLISIGFDKKGKLRDDDDDTDDSSYADVLCRTIAKVLLRAFGQLIDKFNEEGISRRQRADIRNAMYIAFQTLFESAAMNRIFFQEHVELARTPVRQEHELPPQQEWDERDDSGDSDDDAADAATNVSGRGQ